jgi:hypothetical protein
MSPNNGFMELSLESGRAAERFGLSQYARSESDWRIKAQPLSINDL